MVECTSVLKPMVAALICPEGGYLHSLVLPEHRHVSKALTRTFGSDGRMAKLTGAEWPRGYSLRPFEVLKTKRCFSYSRESIKANWAVASSGKSLVWTPHLTQVLVRGSLEGRPVGDPRGASLICRRNLWSSAVALYQTLGLEDFVLESRGSYKLLKHGRMYEAQRSIKQDVMACLVGWLPNETDDFSLA
jgi:tRNA-specific adenosine deaminase 1